MASPTTNTITALTGAVLATPVSGISHVPAATPLTRLNYFDGRFLRAEDLELEQRYVRELVALSNQAGGAGVVHGFTVDRRSGDRLTIEAGLAITAAGRVVFLPDETSIGIAELIARSTAAVSPPAAGVAGAAAFDECTIDTASPPTQVGDTTDYWILTVGPADVLCGEEVVYGRLCEDACSTDTEHNHRVDALVFRAIPVTLALPESSYFGSVHLRSRVASAYYANERSLHPSLISGAGLRSPEWCDGAAGLSGSEVPLALIARSGSITRFVDMWTARRERLEPPAMVHWQQKMRMRPLDVFLAQVLQFQCQLPDALEGPTELPAGVIDKLRECIDEQESATPTVEFDEMLLLLGNMIGSSGGLRRLAPEGGIRRIGTTTIGAKTTNGPGTLMAGGIVELPSAGWLPVTPGTPVEPQIQRLLGSGVDLRFCAVRHDFPPEAFWEAQHLDRIRLWEGLEDPGNRPEVDILVPDPTIETGEVVREATAFATQAQLSPEGDRSVSVLSGVTRVRVQNGQTRIAGALTGALPNTQSASGTLEHIGSVFRGDPIDVRRRESVDHLTILDEGEEVRTIRSIARRYLEDIEATEAEFEFEAAQSRMLVSVFDLTVGGDPLAAEVGDRIPISFSLVAAFPSVRSRSVSLDVDARMEVTGVLPAGSVRTITGQVKANASRNGGSPESFAAAVTMSLATREGGVTHLAIKGLPVADGPDGLPPVDLVAQWGGSPIRATVALIVKGPRRSDPVLRAELTESAAVLLDGNQFHERAETAIEAVAAILEDRERAVELERFILDRAEAPRSTRSLVPTRDWVMFHRRRPIECEIPAPPEPPKPPPPAPKLDRVDIVALFPKTTGTAEETMAALGDGSLTLESSARITGVDFLPDSGVMVTADTVVEQAVAQALGSNRRLLGVGYVGTPSPIRAGRVSEFADALEMASGDVSLIDAAASDRGYQGAGEVFVLVAGPPVVAEETPITTTHVVYDATGADHDRLLEFVASSLEAGATFDEVIEKSRLPRMGTVTFSGASLFSHTLPTDTPSQFAELYVVVASDPRELTDELVQRRAEGIAEVIGRPVERVEPMTSPTVMTAPAWIVTRRIGETPLFRTLTHVPR